MITLKRDADGRFACDEDEDVLLTVNYVAELLRVPVTWINYAISMKVICPTFMGDVPLIYARDLYKLSASPSHRDFVDLKTTVSSALRRGLSRGID